MDVNSYLAAAGGVATSILLPVMVRAVRAEFNMATPAAKKVKPWLVRVAITAWPIVRKYFLLLLFSFLTALLIISFLGDSITAWQGAFIAGYTWDSTIQKITQKP